MRCPKCKNPMKMELQLIGGCMGHFGEERCYCDSPDVRMRWVCRHIKNNGRYCNVESFAIPGLTDRDAIERWIIKTYNEM